MDLREVKSYIINWSETESYELLNVLIREEMGTQLPHQQVES